MPDHLKVNEALRSALSNVLRSLFRLLLRHAMPYTAFEELARRTYVEVAMKDFSIEGKKPSISRASILSGLTRKEVGRLISLDSLSPDQSGEQYNRAARVLTAWVRDADYLDAKGAPRVLTLEGPQGFAELVRRHSGDMPVRAVLDELLRVGAVNLKDERHLALRTRAYVPPAGVPEKMGILGQDVADLIATIDHNIQHGEADPRVERKVMYVGIGAGEVAVFRQMAAWQGQSLLEHLDGWLQVRDKQADPNSTEPRARVGMGIYYFEEPSAPTSLGEAR